MNTFNLNNKAKNYLSSLLFLLICFQLEATAQEHTVKFKDWSISYESHIHKESDVTLVFVHGWCIDKSYWKPQVDHFAKNTSVVTLDLPGFGNSSSTVDSDYSISYYADFLNEFINHLNLDNIVLIGHSFASDIVLEATLNNEHILAIVGVDAFKDVDLEMTAELENELNNFYGMLEGDFKTISQAYAEQALFSQETDETIKKQIKEDFASCDKEIAINSLKSTYTYATLEKEKLKKLNQKLYLINSSNTPTNTDYFTEHKILHEVFNIDQTGHYPMLEKPQQFNKHLSTILKGLK